MIEVRWEIGNKAQAIAAIPEIGNNRGPVNAVPEKTPRTVVPKRAMRLQVEAAETAWGIGALPAAGTRGTRVLSAVPDPAGEAPVRAVRVAHRAWAGEETDEVGAAGADEGEQAMMWRKT